MSTDNPAATEQPSIEEVVNEAVSSMTETDGKWSLPEEHGLSPEMEYAVNAERRRRDTQSAVRSDQLDARPASNGIHLWGRQHAASS